MSERGGSQIQLSRPDGDRLRSCERRSAAGPGSDSGLGATADGRRPIHSGCDHRVVSQVVCRWILSDRRLLSYPRRLRNGINEPVQWGGPELHILAEGRMSQALWAWPVDRRLEYHELQFE